MSRLRRNSHCYFDEIYSFCSRNPEIAVERVLLRWVLELDGNIFCQLFFDASNPGLCPGFAFIDD